MKNLVFIFLLFSFCFSHAQSSNSDEQAGKIWMEGDLLYGVIPDFGVVAFDISSPTTSVLLGSIYIPGVQDVAIRGNFLFCNEFNDLVCLNVDFEKDLIVRELARSENVFPNIVGGVDNQKLAMLGPDETRLLMPIERLLRISPGVNPNLQGSMSILAFGGNNIYAVNENTLLTFDANVTDTDQLLTIMNEQSIDRGDLETVYTNGDGLYIGSRNAMYIYDIAQRDRPIHKGTYIHSRSCDPVFVVGNTAYVTMRDGTDCRGRVNQLTILDISRPSRPIHLRDYPMVNPHGLSVTSGKEIILCDGRAGLKVLDATNPRGVITLSTVPGFMAYDVIYREDKQLAAVSTVDGIRMYDMTDLKSPKLLDILKVDDKKSDKRKAGLKR